MITKVYFVLAEYAQKVKIGKAIDVQERLRGLQTGCPEALTLLLTLDCRPPFEEVQLHKRFSHLRGEGEWFAYRDELKKFISEKRVDPTPNMEDDWAIGNAEFFHPRQEDVRLSRPNRKLRKEGIPGYPSGWTNRQAALGIGFGMFHFWEND